MPDKEIIIQKAALMKALSNPIRLCVIKHLCEKGPLYVSFFVNCMDASQSLISQNLIKLKDLGILGSRKEGQNVQYFIKNNEVKKIIQALFEGEKDV